MRPDVQLSSLLGLTPAGGTISNGYLKVETGSAPGKGIVDTTIQYHDVADKYTLNGSAAIATLYTDATTATANPAVTIRSVGTNGGQAAAFTYDLAKSVVYTRQGNPAWKDINGDAGWGPVRSDDLFHNGTDPDWVDRDKIAIPQADEQQRLLANLILMMNLDNHPLPRFWYFPRGEKAVVMLTSDDHSSGHVPGRIEHYKALSPAGCTVDDWECVRSSMYIYSGTVLSDTEAMAYTAEGFEIGVHVINMCSNYTLTELENDYTTQLSDFAARFPGLPLQTSERTHCVAWSGWDYQPKVKEQKGIGIDTNYYYWPADWVNDEPGLFTGSGIPMRFAELDGTILDVYQVVTQMSDEGGQTFPYTIDTLISLAIGPEGYYGVFTANMHTDNLVSAGANAIINTALNNSVPVVSGRQLMNWLDGRNGSSFGGFSWASDRLTFSVTKGVGADGLNVMLPIESAVGSLSWITYEGSPVSYVQETIKGIEYAIFDGQTGSYIASYEPGYILGVEKDGVGSGTVTSSPAGIDCGGDCYGIFDVDTIVTLTATPEVDSEFAGWSGAGCEGTGNCVITIDGMKSVTATFNLREKKHLSVLKYGTGTGRVTSNPTGIDCGNDCEELFYNNTVVTLSAVAEPGSTFTGWSGAGCIGTGPCVITMNDTKSVEAYFTLDINSYTLSVSKEGNGSGTVTSNPVGINCGDDCGRIFDMGTVVILTATPDNQSIFAGWSGAGCSGTGTCEITMNEAKSVKAEFKERNFLIFIPIVFR
jgi:hypothetical protein